MPTSDGPPDGIERRREHLQLTAVMEEVSTLERSVIALASSVTKIIPDQIQVGVAEIRRLFYQIVAVVAVAVVVLLGYSVIAVGHLKSSIDKGHAILTCILLTPESQRSPQTVITCRETSH